MDSDTPTNPDNLKPTLEDLISSLVGSVQRLEVQMEEFKNTPPIWMKQFLQRLELLENNCKKNHGNNHQQRTLF
jgi:hypothetical protein